MSVNRQTRIRLVENGKVIKTISNAIVNFSLDYQSLQKMISLAIRLSPQDPLYEINEVVLNTKDENIVLNETEAEKVKTIVKANVLKMLKLPSSENAMTLTVSIFNVIKYRLECEVFTC